MGPGGEADWITCNDMHGLGMCLLIASPGCGNSTLEGAIYWGRWGLSVGSLGQAGHESATRKSIIPPLRSPPFFFGQIF